MPDQGCAKLIHLCEELAAPRQYLARYCSRGLEKVADDTRAALNDVKGRAVKADNQLLAKAVWCLETIATVQDHYLTAFAQLKAGKYYEGWCELERCEIELHFLDRHYEDDKGLFGLEFIRAHTERYQELFPYAVFISPAFLKEEVRCTTCGARVSLRNHCGHRVGEIYNGQQCGREITKARLLEVSLVTNPSQKYSVAFTGEGDARDRHDYSTVRFVIQRLQSPWHEWTYRWTRKRHPHERYRDVAQNEPCPCGSNREYKECCLEKSGVLRPHCEIEFSVPPPPDLASFEYSTSS